jgi:hypothetical protein
MVSLIALARKGGIQSIPYDIAIKHNPMRQAGRPIAKKKSKKQERPSLGDSRSSGDKP